MLSGGRAMHPGACLDDESWVVKLGVEEHRLIADARRRLIEARARKVEGRAMADLSREEDYQRILGARMGRLVEAEERVLEAYEQMTKLLANQELSKDDVPLWNSLQGTMDKWKSRLYGKETQRQQVSGSVNVVRGELSDFMAASRGELVSGSAGAGQDVEEFIDVSADEEEFEGAEGSE